MLIIGASGAGKIDPETVRVEKAIRALGADELRDVEYREYLAAFPSGGFGTWLGAGSAFSRPEMGIMEKRGALTLYGGPLSFPANDSYPFVVYFAPDVHPLLLSGLASQEANGYWYSNVVDQTTLLLVLADSEMLRLYCETVVQQCVTAMISSVPWHLVAKSQFAVLSGLQTVKQCLSLNPFQIDALAIGACLTGMLKRDQVAGRRWAESWLEQPFHWFPDEACTTEAVQSRMAFFHREYGLATPSSSVTAGRRTCAV